jgi:hypothetical protein
MTAPAAFAPRGVMHEWVARSTQAAPRVPRFFVIAAVTWSPRRSCTCGRAAYSCTTRASFDSPTIRPAAAASASPGVIRTMLGHLALELAAAPGTAAGPGTPGGPGTARVYDLEPREIA